MSGIIRISIASGAFAALFGIVALAADLPKEGKTCASSSIASRLAAHYPTDDSFTSYSMGPVLANTLLYNLRQRPGTVRSLSIQLTSTPRQPGSSGHKSEATVNDDDKGSIVFQTIRNYLFTSVGGVLKDRGF